MLTGTPVIHKDRIIVPVSGSGVITGGNPNYECCENHGAVTALNVRTGERSGSITLCRLPTTPGW